MAVWPDHVTLRALELHNHRNCLCKLLSFVNTEICRNVWISDWTWRCYCNVRMCRWQCPEQRRASWKTRLQLVSCCSRVQVILKHVQGHELTLWSLPSDANISSACQGIPRILYNPKVHCGTRGARSWLRHCATNRKVAGSIPDGVIGIFHWYNLSGRTMALGLTQPLTEMSTRNISW